MRPEDSAGSRDAQTHAIVLAYALAYNEPMIPTEMIRLARAMQTDDAIGALLQLERECAIPLALRDVGMPREGIAAAVEQAMVIPYGNPHPIDAGALTDLLEYAWAGGKL